MIRGMQIRFWGVRGSVPWATTDSIGHGCNTPCIEVRDTRDGRVLVLDAGSGIVGLGESLGDGTGAVPILLTHFHWDHTQGLPFFAPFYDPGWQPSLWAPALDRVAAEWADAVFASPFFPVPFDRLPNRPTISIVRPGPIEIGGFQIAVQPLNHPGGAFAYRIRGEAGDFVYATDHEFGNQAVDDELARFCRGAAALVTDAHFTPDELARHRGWGHATWRQAAELAARSGAGRLWLFHHKPGRTDAELDAIEAAAQAVFPATAAAVEGHAFDL